MNATAVLDAIREQQPFQPLKLEFTGGRKEIVRHPDSIMVFASYLIIAQYDKRQEVPDRPKRYPLLHLASIEPAKSQTN